MSAATRHTTIKLRIHPTPEQAALLEKTFGCCRWLWNQMLADEQEFYAATGKHFIPTPARYKKGAPFLKEADSLALAAVHQNLKRAFQNFFARPDVYGYPVFKRKKAGRDSYTTFCQYFASGPTIYLTREGIRLPKLGIVPARFHRRPLHWWTLKSAAISRTPSGRYDCALLFAYPEKEREPAAPAAEKLLGLQCSAAHFYVDSEGGTADLPPWLEASREKLERLQRRLAGMTGGSRNYQEQLGKIRRLQEHIANQRRDFAHKESRRIANAWDAVCLRDFDLQAANRSNGFGHFRDCLAYKLAEQGKRYLAINPAFPIAKRCHACGGVNEDFQLPARRWRCPRCGAELQRDLNAARNLRDAGLALLEGGG